MPASVETSSHWIINGNTSVKDTQQFIQEDFNKLRDKLYDDLKVSLLRQQGGGSKGPTQEYIKLCFEFIRDYKLLDEAIEKFTNQQYCDENIPIIKGRVPVLSIVQLPGGKTTSNVLSYNGKNYYMAKDWWAKHECKKYTITANVNKLALLLWIGSKINIDWSRKQEITAYNSQRRLYIMSKELNDFVKKIRNVLEQNNIDIGDVTYESCMIDSLAKGDVFQTKKANGSDSQTHIAITGKDAMGYFPYAVSWEAAHNDDYSNNRLFMVKIKGNLIKVPGLDEEIFSGFNTDESPFIPVEGNVSYVQHSGKQVEFCNPSYTSDIIRTVREAIGETIAEDKCWLIVLKRCNEFIYDLLFLKNSIIETYDNEQSKDNDKLLPVLSTNVVIPKKPVSLIDLDLDIDTGDNSDEDDKSYTGEREKGGHNLIVYGAPGTGKSHKLEEEYGKDMTRVVFHPEYSYFDFIGSYRPAPVYAETTQQFRKTDGAQFEKGEPYVDYTFVPGPFTNVLVEAWKNPDKMYNLLIEEMNRADAAAVFGDVFQLLDRDNDGQSDYSITPSAEWREYLISQGLRDVLSTYDGIRIPSNMNLLATMNSADQGVNVLDTAFKRRWEYQFMELDYTNVRLKVNTLYGGRICYWSDFIKSINDRLNELYSIGEDRLVGQYFVAPDDLEQDGVNEKAVKKVLFYLWDDVLRHESRSKMFGSIKTMAELYKKFKTEDVMGIYSDSDEVEDDEDDEALQVAEATPADYGEE